MKKRNSFAFLSLAGVAILGLASCDKGNEPSPEPGPEEHQHVFSELHEKVEPTCLTEGREAYYTCDGCDKIFNENKEEVEGIVSIPTIDHVPHHHEAVAPGCETTGLGEYWTCDNEVDEKLYGDAQCSQVITEIPVVEATGHDLKPQNGQDATCTEAGFKGWFECEDCDHLFEDEEGTKAISDLASWKTSAGKIDAKGHSTTLVEGQKPTKTASGWKDYYECSRCHKLFEEASADTEITNLDNWKQNRGYLPATWIAVESLTLSATSTSIERGATSTLSVAVSPENADDKSYDISVVSGSSYISLDGNVVTGVAAGTAKLKAVAKDGGVSSNELEITVYTVPVTLTVNGGNGGGSYLKGDSVTVTPEVPENKEFVAWKNGEDVVSTDSSYTFTITADTELTAEFKYTDAYLERDDMFYNNGEGILAWNPDNAVSVATSGLTENSAFGYKMTAGRGQFHLQDVYDLTLQKVVFDIKAKEADTKVTVRFDDSNWSGIANSDVSVTVGTEWASYGFAPGSVTSADLTQAMLFTVVVESGDEIVIDNLRVEDASHDAWYLERNDMFYTRGKDIIAWNPDNAVSEVTEGLAENSAFGFKMTAGRGQFHLGKGYDLTTSKVVFDIKAKAAGTKVTVKFHNSSWGDVANSSIDVYAGTEWATYGFAPGSVSDDDLTSVMLFTINLGSGAEILMDNLRIESATGDEWYLEKGDMTYKATVAEEKAGNVFAKVTEGLQEGSAAAISISNTDAGTNWPSLLLRLPEAVDLTKNKLVMDAKVVSGVNWFSLKFYDSKWAQYTDVGEKGVDLTAGEWNTVEFGRFAGATDVKFIRIGLNNSEANKTTLLLDNMHLDSSNNLVMTGAVYTELVRKFTAEETFGRALRMDYKLEGGSTSSDYAHVVLMNTGWKNITGEIDLRADGTCNKGTVEDLGNGWHRVIIDVSKFNGDGSPRDAITHFRLEKFGGASTKLTVNLDTLGFVDFTREYEYGAGGDVLKGIGPITNWSSRKLILDVEPGDANKGGQKFVLGLRDASKNTLAKFTIRLTDHIAKKGNNGADIYVGTQVEGNVYRYEIDLSLLDIEFGDGTDSFVSLAAEEAWMDMIVHSVQIA